MSVTTSAPLNADQLQVALPAGVAFYVGGGTTAEIQQLPLPLPKTIVATTDDATLQAAITTAAGLFIDRAANRGALTAKAQNALANNATFLGIASPTQAQAIAQVQALTRQVNALIRLALNALDSTANT